MNRYAITLGAAVAILASGTATATVVTKVQYSQVSGTMCQGALPNFDTSFRKRPLAIANEGSTDAFLTCGLTSQYDVTTGGVSRVRMYVTNRSATNSSMSCTLVDGFIDATLGFADYFPQTLAVASSGIARFNWTASVLGGTNAPVFGYPAISCDVPASFELNEQDTTYSEEIGA